MTTSQGRAATMCWASASSREAGSAVAAEAAAAEALAALGEGPVDLALVFFSAAHAAAAQVIRDTLAERLKPGTLAGVSASGVITAKEEIEQGPALSLVLARLPGVSVAPFIVPGPKWMQDADDAGEFARLTPGLKGAEIVLLFGDPFSLEMNGVLAAFNRHASGMRVVGGMASAAQQPGGNALVLNDWVAHDGGLALALKGALRADVIVSQGCRPVGPALKVTSAERNLIMELDGVPATLRVQQIYESLPTAEQELFRDGLMVGRPARRGAHGRGDYVIRNFIGHDPKSGSLAVGDLVPPQEPVRLHVRDSSTAREDLEMLLSPQAFDAHAQGALLFSCNGRGRNLYAEANGDITPLQLALGGNVPVGGFFCAGEIGPVGERNFIHGHTACIVIVRPK